MKVLFGLIATFFTALFTIVGTVFIGMVTAMASFVIWIIIGTVLQMFLGTQIAEGLNLIFNTTRFEPANIPLVCGILSFLGSFFRSNTTVNQKSTTPTPSPVPYVRTLNK